MYIFRCLAGFSSLLASRATPSTPYTTASAMDWGFDIDLVKSSKGLMAADMFCEVGRERANVWAGQGVCRAHVTRLICNIDTRQTADMISRQECQSSDHQAR